MNRRRYLAGALVGLAGGLAGCLDLLDDDGPAGPRYTEPIEESRDASGVSAVTFAGRVGDVTVRSVDGDRITVEGEKRTRISEAALDRVRLELRASGDRLDVVVVYEGTWSREPPSVDLTVGLPAGVALQRLELDVGEVAVEGVPGPLAVRSNVGSVDVRDLEGNLSLESDVGDVTVDGVAGFVDARADVGRLEVLGAAGVDRAVADVGEVVAEVRAVRGATEVGTDVGSVTARLGPELSCELDAESQLGTVDASGLDLSGLAVRTRSVSGTVGEGGPRLHVFAESGSVTLASLSA